MASLIIAFVGIISFTIYFHVHATSPPAYYAWYPLTKYKTVSFLPAMSYDRAQEVCRRMKGTLLTFSDRDIHAVVRELLLLHGPHEYWVGITREPQGTLNWGDGVYVSTRGLNFPPGVMERSSIGYGVPRGMTRECASLSTTESPLSTRPYVIQLNDCLTSKISICEDVSGLGPFAIIAITALTLSSVTFVLIIGLWIYRCFFRSRRHYIPKTYQQDRRVRPSRPPTPSNNSGRVRNDVESTAI